MCSPTMVLHVWSSKSNAAITVCIKYGLYSHSLIQVLHEIWRYFFIFFLGGGFSHFENLHIFDFFKNLLIFQIFTYFCLCAYNQMKTDYKTGVCPFVCSLVRIFVSFSHRIEPNSEEWPLESQTQRFNFIPNIPSSPGYKYHLFYPPSVHEFTFFFQPLFLWARPEKCKMHTSL